MKTILKNSLQNGLKAGIAVVAFAFFVSTAHSQQLEFSQALIVDNNQVTVPAGHVWQVTSVYGMEFRVNECIDISPTSTHELSTARCAYMSANRSLQLSYQISSFKVNGAAINSFIKTPGNTSVTMYTASTTCIGSTSSLTRDFTCANKDSGPNILPIWLPAGTTLESGGPNTFVSVVEYKVY